MVSTPLVWDTEYSCNGFSAGPVRTSPLKLNSDPWQGHNSTAPAGFTVQSLCVHNIRNALSFSFFVIKMGISDFG